MSKRFLNDGLVLLWLPLVLILILALCCLTLGEYEKFCVSAFIIVAIYLITGVKWDLILWVDFDLEKIQVLILCFGIPYTRLFELEKTHVKSIYVNDELVNVVLENSEQKLSMHRMSTAFQLRIIDYTIQIGMKQVEDRML